MRYVYAASAVLLALVSASAWHAFSQTRADRTWDVIFQTIPRTLKPSDAKYIEGNYLLDQTHATLFQHVEEGEYRSTVLARWSQDFQTRTIVLCPNTDLILRPGYPFTTEFLKEFLARRDEELKIKARLSIAGGVLNVDWQDSAKSFFETYSSMMNEPTLAIDGIPYESGLGAFYFEKFEDGNAVFQRKQPGANGFTTIVAHPYTTAAELAELAKKIRIEEFNRIPIEMMPKDAMKDYVNYGPVLLQNALLVMNHADPLVRRLIYNCIDIHAWRHSFSPALVYKDIKNILPLGVVGAEAGMPDQDCDAAKQAFNAAYAGKPKIQIVAANHKDTNLPAMKIFYENLSRDLGVNFINLHVTGPQIQQYTLTHKPVFNLFTFGSLIGGKEHSDLYLQFFNPKRNVFSELQVDMTDDLARLAASKDEALTRQILAKLNARLHSEYMVLPVGQPIRDYFYPPELKHFSLGEFGHTNPLVAEIQL